MYYLSFSFAVSKAEQFLDWINIQGNVPGSSELQKNLTRNVHEALKPGIVIT
jgi:hypothetical protein